MHPGLSYTVPVDAPYLRQVSPVVLASCKDQAGCCFWAAWSRFQAMKHGLIVNHADRNEQASRGLASTEAQTLLSSMSRRISSSCRKWNPIYQGVLKCFQFKSSDLLPSTTGAPRRNAVDLVNPQVPNPDKGSIVLRFQIGNSGEES